MPQLRETRPCATSDVAEAVSRRCDCASRSSKPSRRCPSRAREKCASQDRSARRAAATAGSRKSWSSGVPPLLGGLGCVVAQASLGQSQPPPYGFLRHSHSFPPFLH